jgi:CBS domain-containing protein
MYEFLEYQVADAMTYHPVAVGRATTLGEVWAVLEEHGLDCVPVTEEGALVGMVRKTDVLDLFAATPEAVRYEEVMGRPAESVVTRWPVTVTPGTSVLRVLQLMAETRCRTFPVLIGALLIGVISRRDVLRALARAAAGERPRGGPPSWRTGAMPTAASSSLR